MPFPSISTVPMRRVIFPCVAGTILETVRPVMLMLIVARWRALSSDCSNILLEIEMKAKVTRCDAMPNITLPTWTACTTAASRCSNEEETGFMLHRIFLVYLSCRISFEVCRCFLFDVANDGPRAAKYTRRRDRDARDHGTHNAALPCWVSFS